MLGSGSGENVFGVFWVQDWWRELGIAIVDCRYPFVHSELTVIRLYTRSVKEKLFTYISNVAVYK
jgi:hypothetical protein